jgi:hypothetical protein
VSSKPRSATIARFAVCAALAGAALVSPPALADAPPLAWSTPRVLDASLAARQPRVALTDQGELLVAWTRQGHVLAAVLEPDGHVLNQELWDGDPQAAAQVLLAAAPDGHAAIAWIAGGRLRAAYRRPGKSFSVVTVSGAQRASSPSLAIDDAGQAVLVWQRRPGRAKLSPIVIVRCGTAAGCSRSRILTSRGSHPAVGVDGVGTASVAWISGSKGREVSVVRAPAHGAAGRAQHWVAGGKAQGVHLQVAPDGSAVLGWGVATASDRIGRAAYRPAGGRFSVPFRLTSDLVGFAPILTAPVAGRWWTTFENSDGNPLARYDRQARLAADVTSADQLDEPIDTTGLVADRHGDAMLAVETDNSIQTAFADADGQASSLSAAGPTAGLYPSVEAFPQGAMGGGRVALAWLERSAYDPTDYVKSRSGRVVVATAPLPSR